MIASTCAIIGSLTRMVTVHQRAPSMRAASSTLPSTLARPATTMMKTNGVHCQMSAMMIAAKASDSSASQPFAAKPSATSTALIRPNCASNR